MSKAAPGSWMAPFLLHDPCVNQGVHCSMSSEFFPAAALTREERALRFVKRAHGIRMLGLALGAVVVGTVLLRNDAPAPVWVLMVVHGFVWPHVARLLSGRSAEPAKTEQRNMLVDAAMSGVWVALMQFNLLPSVALVAMLGMDLIAVGGYRLLARGMALQATACAVAAVADGFNFAPRTGLPEMLATLPLLTMFPIVLSVSMHRLSRQVQQQNHLLLQLSSVDSLSGLLNRSHWENAVNAALSRHCCDVAVMLLVDIDQFKRANDQHGHTAGDEVIRKVGKVIRASLRDGDLAGRYGGDEFCVVLCGADMHAAATVAERIRSSVACSLFERAPGLRCTLSIGLARHHTAMRDTREWVKDADAALYRAKLSGRNRFVLAN
ncbi:MAG: diguanylate cyclase [Rhodanobacteraceae bacterium]|nr:MAG: diguanylate cyclase [Rhodanobacteraceae bacterium]